MTFSSCLDSLLLKWKTYDKVLPILSLRYQFSRYLTMVDMSFVNPSSISSHVGFLSRMAMLSAHPSVDGRSWMYKLNNNGNRTVLGECHSSIIIGCCIICHLS